MPSTYSPDLRIELIANGEQSGTWGSTTNNNLGALIEDAISGAASVSVTTANQALTALNGAADQARCAALVLSTTTTANFSVYAPPVTKLYVVKNNSAYAVTLYCSTVIGNTTAAGTGVTIPAGKSALLRADGTNVTEQFDYVVSNFGVGGNSDVTGNATVGGTLGVTGIATFTASPVIPTPSPGDNTTKAASTAFVTTAIAATDFINDPNTDGIMARTADKTATTRTITAGSGVSVTNGNGVSGNPTIANTGVLSVNSVTGAVATSQLGSGTANSTTFLTGAATWVGVLGIGQTWQNLTGSRVDDTWYQNTTSRPIFVYFQLNPSGGSMYVNTVASDTGRIQVGGTDGDSGTYDNSSAVVPVGYFYKSAGSSVRVWSELR